MSSGIYGGDEVGALVFDIGSQSVRAGYAGEDMPKADIPTMVGVWDAGDDLPIDVEKITNRYNIGTAALNVVKPGMNVSNFLVDGLIEDWDMFERVMNYMYTDGLRAEASEHPLLISESPWNRAHYRELMAEMMFEKFDVPAFYVAKSAQLAAYSYGRSSGIVLDSGATHTSAIPICDGLVVVNGIARSPGLGGDLVSDWCRRVLEAQHVDIVPRYMVASKEAVRDREKARYAVAAGVASVTSSWHQYMVKDMMHDFKANVAQVLELPYEKKKPVNVKPVHYEFPSGYHQDFGAERFRIPEFLFAQRVNNEVISAGASQLVVDAVKKCDVDARATLVSQVIVTGGNTLLHGFTERLLRDITTSCHPAQRMKVVSSSSSEERKYGAWIGGSILASLGSFQQRWMSKDEYDEFGKRLIERKCP